jgi:hypothetical protein
MPRKRKRRPASAPTTRPTGADAVTADALKVSLNSLVPEKSSEDEISRPRAKKRKAS